VSTTREEKKENKNSGAIRRTNGGNLKRIDARAPIEEKKKSGEDRVRQWGRE
jgi:hypothetical protein